MNLLDNIRTLFGWTASPEPEFLLFKAAAGVLPPLPANSANAPMLADLLKKAPHQVTWEEILAGRVALVSVMPLEALQAQFGSLADEYKTVTGNEPFTQGSFANPPTSIEGWQTGVVSLMAELTKFRRAKLMFERMRSVLGMTFGVLLLGILLSGFIATQAAYTLGKAGPHLWQILMFAGFCGAGFSVLSRLYKLAWTTQLAAQVEDVQALKKGLVINCILSLTEGVFAASVLYVLFASQLVKGDLFPAFIEPTTSSNGDMFVQFLGYQPAAAVDMAKLLAWAFIAGFAERLVPDKLNQLAGEAESYDGKK